MPIRILIADDHTLVRQGLRAILETQPGFQIAGEAGDGLEAIALTEKLKPDVVVLDLMMPRLNGLEVTRQIAKLTRVLVVSMHANEAYVLEALRGGAYGYILKDSPAGELVEAVTRVAAGTRYLSAPLSERAIAFYTEQTRASQSEPYDTLTRREREVFQLAAEGLSNQEISASLSISPRTVEIHKSNAMHKLNLSTQTDVVRFALRHGIIAIDK